MSLLKIESVIEELDDAGLASDSERTSATYDATVTEWGGATTISYAEVSEGGRADSLITLKDEGITVRRTGAIECELVFVEGERTRSLYKVPPYAFDAEIFTKKIRKNDARGTLDVTILYEMTVGGARKRTRMHLTLGEGER